MICCLYQNTALFYPGKLNRTRSVKLFTFGKGSPVDRSQISSQICIKIMHPVVYEGVELTTTEILPRMRNKWKYQLINKISQPPDAVVSIGPGAGEGATHLLSRHYLHL